MAGLWDDEPVLDDTTQLESVFETVGLMFNTLSTRIELSLRRLEADRFFTDGYNEQVYTPEGIEWVDRVTFKSVLLRHYPELAATGLTNLDNGFEPWDLGKLEPERHPLRAFDEELAAKDRNYAAT